MKVMSCFVGKTNVKVDHIIYESFDEAKKHKVKIVPLIDAKKGDYIKTDNDCYIPVLGVSKMPYGKRGRAWFMRYDFPKFTWKAKFFTNSQRFERKTMVYHPTFVQKNYRQLSKNMLIFVKLISLGQDVNGALRTAYPGVRNIKSVVYTLSKLLRHSRLMEYIEEKGYMNKLKEAFKKEGLNETLLAQEIKKLAVDGVGKDKIWALDLLYESFREREQKTGTTFELTAKINKTDAQAALDEKMKVLALPSPLDA